MGPHLVRDDACQRRLAKAGRAVKQHVIQCFAAHDRRVDIDLQGILQFFLADILVKLQRTKARFKPQVLGCFFGRDDAAVHNLFRASFRIASVSIPAESKAETALIASALP